MEKEEEGEACRFAVVRRCRCAASDEDLSGLRPSRMCQPYSPADVNSGRRLFMWQFDCEQL